MQCDVINLGHNDIIIVKQSLRTWNSSSWHVSANYCLISAMFGMLLIIQWATVCLTEDFSTIITLLFVCCVCTTGKSVEHQQWLLLRYLYGAPGRYHRCDVHTEWSGDHLCLHRWHRAGL